VQCVLDAGAGEQFVRVEWTVPTFSPTPQVSGATVTIVTPEGFSANAFEETDTLFGEGRPGGVLYRFGLPGTGLVPGGTYTLHVRTPTGEEASGTTTIPLVSTAEVPLETFRFFDRERDTVRLAWPRVAGVRSYQVAVRSRDQQGGNFEDFFILSTFRQFVDTSVTIAGTARTFENDAVFPIGAIVNIVVVAVDANYYEYFHPTVDPFAGAPPGKLTGAIGVFGSIAPVMRRGYAEVR
jgi:hypothetical protein